MSYTRIEVRSLDGRWRGPHEGDELFLMRHRGKPGAVISVSRYVNEGLALYGFEAVPFFYGGVEKPMAAVALAQPGDKWRARRIAAEFSKTTRNHARIGLLLGYTKENIRQFIATQSSHIGSMDRKA